MVSLPRVCKTSFGRFQIARKLLELWASPCACAWSYVKCPKVPGTFTFRSNALESAQTSIADSGQAGDSFARVRSQSKSPGKMAIRLQALDRKVNVPGTFGHFTSDQAHAQGKAQSSKSFLALWNRSKLVLQTLCKLTIRVQALDHKVNVPGTFGHFESDQAHAQGEAQSSKSFLALWNRPKLVLQTLGKLAIRFQALDRKVNVPGTDH